MKFNPLYKPIFKSSGKKKTIREVIAIIATALMILAGCVACYLELWVLTGGK
jgi:hypothetical protein